MIAIRSNLAGDGREYGNRSWRYFEQNFMMFIRAIGVPQQMNPIVSSGDLECVTGLCRRYILRVPQWE